MKYQRRTDDDRIAELAAKIEGIRVRAARKAARADPVQQQATVAVRAIEKALRERSDPSPLTTALVIARDAIREALDGSLGAPVVTPIVEERVRAMVAGTKRRARAQVPTE